MWFLVKLPNSVAVEVELDGKSLGQECLDKTCKLLGIFETDFFGLQCTNSRDEKYWLNMRNAMIRQLPGSPPYRMKLRVKFFVQPHYLVQDKTRWLFQITVLEDFVSGRLRAPDESQAIALAGLMAQAEHGDHHSHLTPCHHILYSRLLPAEMLQLIQEQMSQHNTEDSSAEAVVPQTSDLLQKVAQEHERHRGMPRASAVYQALKLASQWPDYGVESHTVTMLDSTEHYRVGVGPKGFTIYDGSNEVFRSFLFGAIENITVHGRSLCIKTNSDDGEEERHDYCLDNRRAANNLYRCITEMYFFFTCDTVKNEVQDQCNEDLKTVLASIFKPEHSKKYIFDIQRTLREACDFNRRQLFRQTNPEPATTSDEEQVQAGEVGAEAGEVGAPLEMMGQVTADVTAAAGSSSGEAPPDIKKLEVQLQELANMFLCRICMDANIASALLPCGHAVSCLGCAERLNNICPMCRSTVQRIQPIYLPCVASPMDET